MNSCEFETDKCKKNSSNAILTIQLDQPQKRSNIGVNLTIEKTLESPFKEANLLSESSHPLKGRTSQMSVTSAISQAGMNPQCKHCGKFVKIAALLMLHQSRCLSNSRIGVVTDQIAILNCIEELESPLKLCTPRSGRSVSCNQPIENMWFRRLRSLSDVRNEQKLNKLSQITQQSIKSSEDMLAEICLT